MELFTDYTIRHIQKSDNTSSFKTGNKSFLPLKNFLKNQALDFQKSMVAQTYVAKKINNVGKEDAAGILGFITLTCSEVDLRNGYTIEDCHYANSYDSLPAIKIARLAVDSRHKGNKIGQSLVDLAIAMAVEVISNQIGCRFIITDSKKEAVEFYKKMGFTLLDTKDNENAENPIMFMDLLHIDN